MKKEPTVSDYRKQKASDANIKALKRNGALGEYKAAAKADKKTPVSAYPKKQHSAVASDRKRLDTSIDRAETKTMKGMAAEAKRRAVKSLKK
jgi:hypothetical protein